jgi:hypothetical protein
MLRSLEINRTKKMTSYNLEDFENFLFGSFQSHIATTQPTTQNKTKQFGCSGIIIGKKTTPPHHHHHGCHYILSHFKQSRKLIFGMQP